MSDEGDCRTAPATTILLKTLLTKSGRIYQTKWPTQVKQSVSEDKKLFESDTRSIFL